MIHWLQISSGRGPAECCWVVSKLADFICHQAGTSGLKADLIEAVSGPMPGTLRSAVVVLEGDSGSSAFAGSWEGTVQWLGRSMFRPAHKRRNWFVKVSRIEPSPEQSTEMADIRIERMRSSGPGGQHANKTETAVRVTHLPTGLSAVCSAERSQHLNKTAALAQLHVLIKERQLQTAAAHEKARWGHHNRLERGNAGHVFKGSAFRKIR